MPDNNRALVAALLANDDEFQDLTRELLVAGLQETIKLLRQGDAVTRAAIAKQLIAPLTQSLQASDDDAAFGAVAEMQAMLEEMRDDLTPKDDAMDAAPKKKKRIV